MQSTRRKNVRYRAKRHKLSNLLSNSRVILGHTFSIVLNYLVPHQIHTSHDEEIARLLCIYAPHVIQKTVISYEWRKPIIQSNNLELIQKYDFWCSLFWNTGVSKYCPLLFLNKQTTPEVFQHCLANMRCPGFHEYDAFSECCDGNPELCGYIKEYIKGNVKSLNTIPHVGDIKRFVKIFMKHRGIEFTLKYMRNIGVDVDKWMSEFYLDVIEAADILNEEECKWFIWYSLQDEKSEIIINKVLKFANIRNSIKLHYQRFIQLSNPKISKILFLIGNG